MRTYLPKITTLLTLLTIAHLTTASSFQGASKIVVSDTLHDDVYYAGETIQIDAPVHGDVFCIGSTIYINADVTEDLTATGGKIYLNAPAKDDVRLAGGKIIITKDIFGDLFIAGGEVTIERDVRIQGDVHMVGGKLIFNGIATGKFWIAGGEVEFNGIAEQAAEMKAEYLRLGGTIRGPSALSAQHIELDGGALFYQSVRYWQKDGELNFGSRLKNGATATFDPSLKGDSKWKLDEGDAWGFILWWFCAGGLIVALLTLSFPRFFSEASHDITHQVSKKFSYGVGYFIGLPLLAIILMVTVIGIPLGLFGMVAFGFSIAFSTILTAVVGAFALKEYKYPAWTKSHVLLVALALFMGLLIVGSIPIIGGIGTSVATCIAFGAVILQILENRKIDSDTTIV